MRAPHFNEHERKNVMLHITLENPDDYKAVERLTFAAFETMELPGRTRTDEHFLAHIMRDRPAFVPELDFIGTIGGEIIANIMYTKSKIIRPDGSETATITFGPVSVKPELHRNGYGGTIIRHSLDAARKLGYGAVIIVGHADYYPRFGFKPASAYNLTMPDGGSFDAFMALELRHGYLGTSGGKWYEDEVFNIDETAFAKWNVEFQKAFL
ncbi:N-acetyltransferase [Clostridia bacterium]|nr:N-acetyltransferase [Clostridia bacterium]